MDRPLGSVVMEYKKILLQKGLEKLNDYQFRTVKCLLESEVGMTRTMRDDCDRIVMADLMFTKFPGPECVDKLIDAIRENPDLKGLVDSLRKEKQNVARKRKAAEEKAKRNQQQDGAGPSTPRGCPSFPGAPGGAEKATMSRKRKIVTKEMTGMKRVVQQSGNHPCPVGASPSRTQVGTESFSPVTVSFQPATMRLQPTTSYQAATMTTQHDTSSISPTTPSSGSTVSSTTSTTRTSAAAMGAADQRGPTLGPRTVMVLERSDLFVYESKEQDMPSMFHATVVTPTKFFRVKVLDATLWELFAENNVLTISGYSELRGIMEVRESSSVSPATSKIHVPNSIIKRARETPKIDDILKFMPGTSVYGQLKLSKKTVNKKNTIYELEDSTGSIDMVGSGQWHELPCERGDKLKLFCLRLRTIKQNPTLTCEEHSLIQVVKSNRIRNPGCQVNVNMQVQVTTYTP